MIKSVRFLSRQYTESMPLTEDFIVISITDPKQALAKISNPSDILRVQFLDITEDLLEPAWENSLFTSEIAKDIASFILNKHKEDKSYHLIVHCEAGVSRSAAVALAAYTMVGCDFPNREEAVIPNQLVLKIMSEEIQLPIEVPPMILSPGGIIIFNHFKIN